MTHETSLRLKIIPTNKLYKMTPSDLEMLSHLTIETQERLLHVFSNKDNILLHWINIKSKKAVHLHTLSVFSGLSSVLFQIFVRDEMSSLHLLSLKFKSSKNVLHRPRNISQEKKIFIQLNMNEGPLLRPSYAPPVQYKMIWNGRNLNTIFQ